MTRSRMVLILAMLVGGCGGGDTSTVPTPEPGEPLAELDAADRGRFLLGRALFERLATPDEGLGPLYNAERCSSCHDQPAVGGGGTEILVLKATRWADERCDKLEASGGDNIQTRATKILEDMGLGPEDVPAEATHTARVTAPPLLGLGLVEAVPIEGLLEWEDPDDRDGDGISGRLPRLATGAGARFGRKGDAATVKGFIDTALRFELGFTTPDHPLEEPRNGRPLPPEADPMPDPEIDGETLDLLTDYVRLLAPPAPDPGRSEAARDTLARGQALFGQIGCTSCHREELRTGPSDLTALEGRSLRPYSDFLLHDLGPDLSDVCGMEAAPGELRTAPLWGLRYRDRLLHDGRAADIDEAIQAHGGEALGVVEAYGALPPDTRELVLRFLRSL